jgi:hypothetical protein
MMATPSPAARGPKKIDVLGDQSDGMRLAAVLPAAAVIPEEAKSWAEVRSDDEELSIARHLKIIILLFTSCSDA